MKDRFGQTIKNMVKMNFGILMGLVILCSGLVVLTDKFATVINFLNVVRQITINLYLACGMTFVTLLGDIDLSVDSVIAVTGCVSAGMITWVGLPVPVGILTGTLCGTLADALNGIIISRTIIPVFIVTLATMNIGRGIARIYTYARTIAVLDGPYTFWGMGSILGLPIQPYLIIVVVVFTSFTLNRTDLGRHIYATGGNKTAFEYSGINVKRVTFFVSVLSEFLTPLAGVLTVGRAFTAVMIMGDGAETDVIAAVVLGGTSVSGGKGSILGTVIGVTVIGILRNGTNLLGIDSFWQYVAQGIVILITVYIDYIKSEEFALSAFKATVGKRAQNA